MPVTLVLPAEPPAQEEIDAILMAADGIVGTAGGASPGSGNCPVPCGESANRQISKLEQGNQHRIGWVGRMICPIGCGMLQWVCLR